MDKQIIHSTQSTWFFLISWSRYAHQKCFIFSTVVNWNKFYQSFRKFVIFKYTCTFPHHSYSNIMAPVNASCRQCTILLDRIENNRCIVCERYIKSSNRFAHLLERQNFRDFFQRGIRRYTHAHLVRHHNENHVGFVGKSIAIDNIFTWTTVSMF